MLKPRLPELNAGESLTDRVINAMWLYLMTYRLADEEKIDENPVWYAISSCKLKLCYRSRIWVIKYFLCESINIYLILRLQ